MSQPDAVPSVPADQAKGYTGDLNSLTLLRDHLEEAAQTAVAIQEHSERVASLGATLKSTLSLIDQQIARMEQGGGEVSPQNKG